MTSRHIPVLFLDGDGVGPELLAQARVVLKTMAAAQGPLIEAIEWPIGQAALKTAGQVLPAETIAAVQKVGLALLGGLNVPAYPPPSPVGRLRRELGLQTEVRPIRSLTHRDQAKGRADLVVIRDLSEGFLADRNMWQGHGEFMPTPDVALAVRVVTREAMRRLSRFTLAYMRSQGRNRLKIVHKAGVFSLSCGLFRDVVKETAEVAPEIKVSESAVDQAAGQLVSQPDEFDVIITTNLFGDILADVGAAMVGELVPSASFGDGVAVFKPAHESLPELAGQGSVNPLPTFLAMEMILRHVGETSWADRLARAARTTAENLDLKSLPLIDLSTETVTSHFCGRLKEE